MVTTKEVFEETYDTSVTVGMAYGISLGVYKALKKWLGLPTKPEDAAKLTALLTASSLVVKGLKEKKYLPENPWKA